MQNRNEGVQDANKKVNVPRIREVVAQVRTLMEDMRKNGISETEIVLGTIVAIQAAPISKSIAENTEVKAFLEKVGTFVKSGLDLLELTKKKS